MDITLERIQLLKKDGYKLLNDTQSQSQNQFSSIGVLNGHHRTSPFKKI